MKRLIVLLGLLFFTAAHAATPLLRDSIYQLEVQLTDQDGKTWPLASRRGHVQLVSMFYSSCTMVCPMIVDTLKLTRKAVDEGDRDRLDLLLISFDPARDSVPVLRQYAEGRRLEAPRWTLARAEPASTRQLAALLGVQYRPLPDGDFNHSSELLLLDGEGRIVARTAIIGRLDPEFVQAVKKTLRAP
ncbi:SCO family protein [Dyella sp. EPa41]|uniref:SCO family protein n=1 Tax=Dyella sp. EPa41 TaxID=1561194 RepID=UPI001915E411|nr:SCO family protein [Dyella sp. EPa41]